MLNTLARLRRRQNPDQMDIAAMIHPRPVTTLPMITNMYPMLGGAGGEFRPEENADGSRRIVSPITM